MKNDYLDYLVSVLNERSTDAYLIRNDDYMWQDWYFSDINLLVIPHIIYWTQQVSNAYKFDRKEDAEEFAKDFIYPRISEVIRLGK